MGPLAGAADPRTRRVIQEPLTPAEQRVLAVMAEADSIRAAAAALGVKPATVSTHLRNIRSKLGVKTTRQAIVKLLGLL